VHTYPSRSNPSQAQGFCGDRLALPAIAPQDIVALIESATG
jgi:hypothetical protein